MDLNGKAPDPDLEITAWLTLPCGRTQRPKDPKVRGYLSYFILLHLWVLSEAGVRFI
jgi:hypothetical protein